jgi:hypothetical protein
MEPGSISSEVVRRVDRSMVYGKMPLAGSNPRNIGNFQYLLGLREGLNGVWCDPERQLFHEVTLWTRRRLLKLFCWH